MIKRLLRLLLLLGVPSLALAQTPAHQCPIGERWSQGPHPWAHLIMAEMGTDQDYIWKCRPWHEDDGGGAPDYSDAACSSFDYCTLFARQVCKPPKYWDMSYHTLSCFITCYEPSPSWEYEDFWETCN